MSNTPISFLDLAKAYVAKDKDAYWFDLLNSDEKKFERMDAWELAEVIHTANVRNTVDWATKKIVAEHLLNVRLAKIQAKPNYLALVTGFTGAIGGVFLTAALQKPSEQSKCICEYQQSAKIQGAELKGVVPVVPVVTKQPDIAKSAAIQQDGKTAEKSKP